MKVYLGKTHCDALTVIACTLLFFTQAFGAGQWRVCVVCVCVLPLCILILGPTSPASRVPATGTRALGAPGETSTQKRASGTPGIPEGGTGLGGIPEGAWDAVGYRVGGVCDRGDGPQLDTVGCTPEPQWRS